MNKNILKDIQDQMSSMGKSQKKVADFIVQEPVRSAFLTIDKIAQASNVSTTTVVRLAQAMGYSSFVAFQQEIQRYIQNYATPLQRVALADFDDNYPALTLPGQNTIFEDITSVIFQNIRETLSDLSYETVSQISDSIASARHVYITGQRGTEPLARYLTFHLNKIFLNVDFLPPDSSVMPEIFQRIDERDVVIACTVYRYSDMAIKVSQFAKENGATVIAISDRYDSPLSPYADYRLVTYCKTRDFHDSGAAMIYLADIIIDTCYRRVRKTARQRLHDAEYYIFGLKIKT